jgi:hypothetical protein
MDNQPNLSIIQKLKLYAQLQQDEQIVQSAKLFHSDKEFLIAFVILAIVAFALPKNIGIWVLVVLFLSALLYSQRVFSDFRKLVGE